MAHPSGEKLERFDLINFKSSTGVDFLTNFDACRYAPDVFVLLKLANRAKPSARIRIKLSGRWSSDSSTWELMRWLIYTTRRNERYCHGNVDKKVCKKYKNIYKSNLGCDNKKHICYSITMQLWKSVIFCENKNLIKITILHQSTFQRKYCQIYRANTFSM